MSLNEIEDLDNLENSGSEGTNLELSNVYNIRLGGFGDTSELKTYLTSAKVKNLKEDLDLYETLTKDKSWPVSQIVQREVDRIRVSNISKSYILSQGRPIKYFPPIIVAILPKDEHGMISLNMDFGDTEDLDSKKELIYSKSKYNSNETIKPYVLKPGNNLSKIKGLFVLEVSKVFETYLFSWDKSKYYAVVIDGQHRLEALYKSAHEDITVEDFYQDLIFIDFSQLLQSQEELSPVEVVRRIFVDINTNAQRVGFVRQVLMDDKDLSALCVQALVDSVNKDGSSKEQESFIKSQIVDWYGDNLKHTLPHLTGVLSLYQIIDDYLVQESIASINDMRSPRKVSKWVTRLNDVFFVDSTIENAREGNYSDVKPLYTSFSEYEERRSQNLELQAELEDELKESEIFYFDYSILDIARHNFERIYLKPFVKFFNEIKPNKRTIEIIEEEGGFDPSKSLAKALVSSRKKLATTAAYRDAMSAVKVKIEQELISDYFLFFTVLGQKSIFNNLFKKIQLALNTDFNEGACFEIITNQINEVNLLFDFFNDKEFSLLSKKDVVIIENLPTSILDFGTISSQFWDGIIYDNDSIIYNTQGIRSLSYLLSEFQCLNNARLEGEDYIFDMQDVPYAKARTKKILRRRFDYTDDQLENFADEILASKTKFIKNYFS